MRVQGGILGANRDTYENVSKVDTATVDTIVKAIEGSDQVQLYDPEILSLLYNLMFFGDLNEGLVRRIKRLIHKGLSRTVGGAIYL